MPLALRKEIPPERIVAADEIFPESRLGLVDAERHIAARGEPILFASQSLVIDTVPGLVQDAEKGGRKEMHSRTAS